MTTELQIINHMLNVVGEDPVSDPNSTHPSVISARGVMETADLELQSRGWWFNTDIDLTILPNGDGHIVIPQNTLEIDPTDTSLTLVQRRNKLYDTFNHTYVIDESVIVDVVQQLPIEDLPQVAGLYLMHTAAYRFYVGDDGDETKSNRLEKNMDKAWARLQQAELKNADVNAKNRPIVARLRSRTRQGYGPSNPNVPGG